MRFTGRLNIAVKDYVEKESAEILPGSPRCVVFCDRIPVFHGQSSGYETRLSGFFML